tara:strand:+ start:569 stop:967 length:399 start_codon:yes stop_codon:yes gene_type:complete
MNNSGHTLFELVVVILLIGILSAVAVPRFVKRIELEELKAEKDFTYRLWEELELYATIQRELHDEDKWPYHPLSVLGRTRGVIVTHELGIPDEDNEWQFDGTKLYHRRMNNEIWYFTYIPSDFYLSELPTKL